MRADLARLPRALFHADDIRRLEPELAAKLKISLYEVMEEAGRQAFLCLKRRWPDARHVLVICGRGNNGGDGFVLGRLAMQAGLNVQLRQSEPARPLAGDAAKAKTAYLAAGGLVEDIASEDAWPDCDVLVDGLLGSGLSGALSQSMAATIDRMNKIAIADSRIGCPLRHQREYGCGSTDRGQGARHDHICWDEARIVDGGRCCSRG